MNDPGGEEEPSLERIRPAPRPVRPPPTPPQDPIPPAAEVSQPSAVVPRPDRSRMGPLSLDWNGSRKQHRAGHKDGQVRRRTRRVRPIDRWLRRSTWILGLIVLALGAWWLARQLFFSGPVTDHAPSSRSSPGVAETPGERARRMVQRFLSAPDAAAKSVFVLEPERMLPLMAEAYGLNQLPEASLTVGVPLAVEEGIFLVPASVSGPPDFAIHLVIREEAGVPRLDWETYHQEISQRFIRFAAAPYGESGDFRLVVERVDDPDPGSDKTLTIRVAPPGSAALASPVAVAPAARATVVSGLAWGERRRALVRLAWESSPAAPPRMVLREVVKWEFIP